MVLPRKAAQAASSAFKHQDQTSSESGGDGGGGGMESKQKKPVIRTTYGGAKKRGRARTMSSLQASTIPQGRKSTEESPVVLSSQNRRKRELSISPARSESPLSSVSSLEFGQIVRSTPRVTGTPTKAAASVMELLGEVLTPRSSVLARSGLLPEDASSTLSASQIKAQETWSMEKLDSLVWIRISRHGEVFDGQDCEHDGLWWPGKISGSKTMVPLEVILMGQSELSSQTARINSPSSLNILSLYLPNGGFRFNTYEQASGNLDELQPLQKKAKTDLARRWQDAYDDMVIMDTANNDHLPPRISAVKSVSPTKKPRDWCRGKRKAGSSMSTESSSVSDMEESLSVTRKEAASSKRADHSVDKVIGGYLDWEVDDDDDYGEAASLNIPGELVFAREPRHKNCYWPARVLEHIPKKGRKGIGKYRVEFLDGSKRIIKRDFFYASFEPGFTTCELGAMKSSYKLDADYRDDSDGEDDRQRSVSPVPLDPPPTGRSFMQLELPDQFAYVKPVLSAVLNDCYGPTSQRHAKFMQGGSTRAKLYEDASKKGRLSGKDVSQLTKLVMRWVLREKARGEIIRDEQDSVLVPAASGSNEFSPNGTGETTGGEEFQRISPSSDPSMPPSSLVTSEDVASDSNHQMEDDSAREFGNSPLSWSSSIGIADTTQKGCPAYEQLFDHEKLDYCTNILVPEAVIQILLWRNGNRKSIHILSNEEEERLHRLGEELTDQFDWVNEVLKVRNSHKNIRGSKGVREGKKEIRVGGTSTRPKMKEVC